METPRLTVALTFDHDAISDSVRRADPPVKLSHGEFGPRVGVPRILELLAREAISSTWFVPGHTLITFPESIEAILTGGHELASHGWYHEDFADLPADEAAAILERCAAALRAASGTAPRGHRAPYWALGPGTLELVEAAGFVYDSSLMADDFRLYRVRHGDRHTVADGTAFGAEASLIEVPVYWGLDDWPLFEPAPGRDGLAAPSRVLEIWTGELRYARAHAPGGLLTVTMHPECIGRGHRMAMLEQFIARRARCRASPSGASTRTSRAGRPRPSEARRLAAGGRGPSQPSSRRGHWPRAVGRPVDLGLFVRCEERPGSRRRGGGRHIARPRQDVPEHPPRQPAGEGVLLARVVRAEEHPFPDQDLRPMPEPRPRPGHGLAGPGENAKHGIPAELAQGEDDPCRVQDRDLPGEERRAGVPLLDRRPVRGRRATHRGRDPHPGERQAVVGTAAGRAIREPEVVQRRPQEVAGRVAGKDATRPVRAVGRRRQANDVDPRVRIPEARRGPAPVGLVAEPGDLLARHPLPPGHEAGAAPALHDLVPKCVQRLGAGRPSAPGAARAHGVTSGGRDPAAAT
jgi:peptidoglycan/xylan/chitin deacetylase (PgdA/CDA1 family)